MAAKSSTMSFFVLFLVLAGTTKLPTASSFDLIPDIFKCWKAVAEIEQCVVKLIPSLLNLHVEISQDCCKAFVHIEESCFPAIFDTPVLGPGLANITSSICGAFAEPPLSA